MSFSSIIKEELCHVDTRKKCCVYAELASVFCMNSPDGASVDRFVTENAAFARRAFNLLRGLRLSAPDITARKNRKLKKNAAYAVHVSDVEALYREFHEASTKAGGSNERNAPDRSGGSDERNASDGACVLDERNASDIDVLRGLTRKKCCKKAALRGAFLAGGSATDPEKLYHLEIYCKRASLTEFYAGLMSGFGLNPKVTERTDYSAIYIKDSELIVDFLNVTGAHRALMSLENTRILKDMRNNVNRVVNCETANLEKTVNASLKQITNIIYIRDTVGFDALPENLREIAGIRAANREISLKELGQLLTPPLGKSGVNHRLRKIGAIADDLRGRAPL